MTYTPVQVDETTPSDIIVCAYSRKPNHDTMSEMDVLTATRMNMSKRARRPRRSSAPFTCSATSFSSDDIGHSLRNRSCMMPRVRADDIVLEAPWRTLERHMMRMKAI